MEEVKVRRSPRCRRCAVVKVFFQAKVAELRDEKKKSDASHLLNR